MVQAFFFAVIVAFIREIIPIIKALRLSVKDVVLNDVETVENKKLWKLILGVIFIASTLLYLLGGLDKPTSGNIKIAGKELSNMKDKAQSIMRRKDVMELLREINLKEGKTIVQVTYSLEVVKYEQRIVNAI